MVSSCDGRIVAVAMSSAGMPCSRRISSSASRGTPRATFSATHSNQSSRMLAPLPDPAGWPAKAWGLALRGAKVRAGWIAVATCAPHPATAARQERDGAVAML